MIEDPSYFAPRVRRKIEEYARVIARTYNTDHEGAKKILAEIADMCGRMEALHMAIKYKETGNTELYSRFVAAANIGYEEKE